MIEHICTPETCPPAGGYYVSALDGDRHHLMAGPYQTHAEALGDVDKALRIANEHDGRAWFMGWGTVRKTAGELKPGALNKNGLI